MAPSAGFRDRLSCRKPGSGFTLIEIMIVVSIMAVVMTMSVPIIYRMYHKEPMRKALVEIEEVLSNARARAILRGAPAEVVFHPREGTFEVSLSSTSQPSPTPAAAAAAAALGAGMPAPAGVEAPPAPGSGMSGKFDERISIDMLDVNLTEYRDAEEAHVRFYPNGSCDELTLILHDDRGEQRGVTLEITTSLASILNSEELQRLRGGSL